MALALYQDRFWLPDGSLADGVPVQVFQPDTNLFVQLWADAAGTIPLPNPGTSTDPGGLLTFWAEAGSYWLHLDTESFLIDVGMTEEQADLSTGIASGGELNANPGDPLAIDILPFVGYVVDNSQTGPGAPTVTRVNYPGATGVQLDGPAQARSITWWLMDAAGTIFQQATRPGAVQRRTLLVLGATVFDTGLGQIIEVQTIQVWLSQPVNQLADLMDGLGPFWVTGNTVSPVGANLQIRKDAGLLFARGFNQFASGVLTDRPHVSDSPAQNPATFRRIMRTATVPTPPPVLTLDVANYDLNGVLTPVGGGANTSTVQRVYLFAANTLSAQIAVQYGQQTYASLTAAVNAIGAGTHVSAPIAFDGALIGYIAVIRTATNLSDPAQAVFVKAGKFATP